MARDLSNVLDETWASAPQGEVVVRIHLFGIRYAEELDGVDPRSLVARAEIPMPYVTEIRMRLADFVTIRP